MFKLTASGILALGTLVVVAAYEVLPLPGLRALSGPPPLFAFNAEWGSGLFVDRLGHILTNRHVVRACRRIAISGQGFRATAARLVALPDDPALDLALLRTSAPVPARLFFSADPWPAASGTGPVPVDAVRRALLAAGRSGTRPATLIGYPGRNGGATPSLDPVMVPASATTPDGRHWYQPVDGPIMQGDSGSPVVDPAGTVIGVLFGGTGPGDLHTAKPVPGAFRQTTHGIEARHGLLVPAAVAAGFARAQGVAVSVGPARAAPQDAGSAAVRVFCFQTWPVPD